MIGVLAVIALAAAGNAGLSGTVTDASGAPVAGVTVVAYDPRFNYASAVSTNAGTWSLRKLPAGRYRLRFLPPDEVNVVDRFLGGAWDICAGDVVEVGESGNTTGIDVSLPTGGTLSGGVNDSLGAPVVGATLVVKGLSDRTSLTVRLATTDDAGHFLAVGLDSDPGAVEPYDVQVATAGWPRQYFGSTYVEDEASLFDVTIGEDAVAGDNVLLDGISVVGTVSGPEGGVAGATVYVYSSQQVTAVTADDSGAYTADGLPPGDVITWASGVGLATTYYPNSDRPGESVSAPDEGGVAVADLSLAAENTFNAQFSGLGDLGAVNVLLYNDTKTVGRGDGVDSDGSVTIGALYPGDYFLYVYGADAGFLDGFIEDEDGAATVFHVEGDSTFDIPLTTGASVSGRIVDDDGAPVYGAFVYLFNASGDNVSVGTSDIDGYYAATGIPDDDYTVRASYVNYCPSDRGWVTKWYESSWTEAGAAFLHLDVGESKQAFDFLLPRDDDHDQMGDAWEREHGLDAAADDAALDKDGDGYSNLVEWQLGTDPNDPGALAECGCASQGSGALGWLGFVAGAAITGRRRQVRRAHTA